MKEPTSAYVISHNDITYSNFRSYFPEIIKRLNHASHIAVDLEFTALGDIRSSDMNHRYVAMKRTVESASIASLGLSIYHKVDVTKPPSLRTAVSESSILSQPLPKPVPEDPIDFSISSSQPVLTKSTSVLSKEEEEGLISSFLDSDEDEFSLPVASCTTTTKTTTLFNDDEFSVTTASTTKVATAIDINKEPPKKEMPMMKQYECDNFNFMTLKQGSIHLETSTARFLVDHGYSFDKLFSDGIPFTPFNRTTGNEFNDPKYGNSQDNALRNLWRHVMNVLKFQKIPFVVHNGFYDLVYIYHSFIGPLPETFKGFIHAISNSFPSGIFDTRYLASQANMSATFLPYVFGASDRLRQNRFGNTKDKPYFEVDVKGPILSNQAQKFGLKRKRSTVEEKSSNKKKNRSYCEKFAQRGYCDHGHDSNSPLHDVQIILDHQLGPSKYPQVYTSEIDDIEGAHAAHFDAYMTGFSYCYFQQTLSMTTLASCRNKMLLSGINVPLTFPPSKDT